MSWSEIKHALNSTLGTGKFQPLDKLIIYGSKQFAPNSDVFQNVFSGSVSSTIAYNTVTGGIVDIASIRPKVGGSFTMSASVSISGVSGNAVYSSILVYINDTYYSKTTFTGTGTSSSGTISTLVPFNAGDKISFKLQGSIPSSVAVNSYAYCSKINVCATVVDNLIEIV